MQAADCFKGTDALPRVIGQALPPRLLDAIQRCGARRAEELRLHAGRVCRVVDRGLCYVTDVILDASEMASILKRMCADSLYAHAQTINQGFLTLEGGIRVGVCGSAACVGEKIIGISNVTGLIVRIPHTVPLSVSHIADSLQKGIMPHGILFYSLPGVGKTTLLRALAMELSAPHRQLHTVIVDTREEIGASLSGTDLDLDILSGYPRSTGIEIAVRSLCAQVILCDEIGSAADADAILSTANCGVPVIATAHAAIRHELLRRPQIKRLHDAMIFGAYVGLSRTDGHSLSFHFTDWETADRICQNPQKEELCSQLKFSE